MRVELALPLELPETMSWQSGVPAGAAAAWSMLLSAACKVPSRFTGTGTRLVHDDKLDAMQWSLVSPGAPSVASSWQAWQCRIQAKQMHAPWLSGMAGPAPVPAAGPLTPQLCLSNLGPAKQAARRAHLGGLGWQVQRLRLQGVHQLVGHRSCGSCLGCRIDAALGHNLREGGMPHAG